MSNLEVEPKELVCEADPVPGDQVTLLEPRLVPLGGPRAMTVRRTLTRRGRSLIGAWCFAEHYGPDDVASSGGMAVPPHPHTGLQTVSWLFAGEIEHRDSTGAHAMVRPGELNLMTAGSGIQHSEVSVVSTLREHQGSPGSTREHRSTREGDGILHGVQLWTALPDASRHTAPHFEHFVPEVFEHQGANTSVFLGSLLGHEATATAFMPIIGAQFDLPANTEITIPVDVAFEHGGLADAGDVTVDGVTVPLANIGYRAVGARALTITSGDAAARASPRRRTIRRADRHVVELRRPQPRRDRVIPRAVAGRADRPYDSDRSVRARARLRRVGATGTRASERTAQAAPLRAGWEPLGKHP